MSTADSEIAETRQRIKENEELLKNCEKRYQEANQRESNFVKEKINLLLEKRREYYQLLEQPILSDDDLIRLDNAEISSNSVIIGNLVVSCQRAGRRKKGVQSRHCERCGGLTNYDEVYPDFEPETWELSSAICKCP